MKLIMLVVKSVLRSKRRTILTVISMTFSFLIFTVLLSMTTTIGSVGNTISPFGLTVRPQEWGLNVPYSYVERMKKEIDGVEHIMGFIPVSGKGRTETDNVTVAAVDAEELREVWPDKKSVLEEQYSAFVKDRKGVLVSEKYLKQYGLKIGDNFVVNGVRMSGVKDPLKLELVIRGISPSGPWGGMNYAHREYVDELIGNVGKVNMIIFNVKSEDYVAKAITDVNEKFPGFECQRESQSVADVLTTLQNINKIMIPMTIIIVGTIILVAANSLAISIRARTAEIAVLKTLGFTNAKVLLLILVEATFISLIGGIIGCFAAYLALNGVTLPIAEGAYFVIGRDTIISGIVISCIIGLVSGFIPAYRASQLKIVDALRRVA